MPRTCPRSCGLGDGDRAQLKFSTREAQVELLEKVLEVLLELLEVVLKLLEVVLRLLEVVLEQEARDFWTCPGLSKQL